jgi:hypothetical protein
MHLDQTAIDAARPGGVGRMVDEHDVADARRAHLAPAVVRLEQRRFGADAPARRDVSSLLIGSRTGSAIDRFSTRRAHGIERGAVQEFLEAGGFAART